MRHNGDEKRGKKTITRPRPDRLRRSSPIRPGRTFVFVINVYRRYIPYARAHGLRVVDLLSRVRRLVYTARRACTGEEHERSERKRTQPRTVYIGLGRFIYVSRCLRDLVTVVCFKPPSLLVRHTAKSVVYSCIVALFVPAYRL